MPAAAAHHVASLPPVASLFAAVLGINPLQHLLSMGGVLATLPADAQRALTGREYFPHLLSGPFERRVDHRLRRLGRVWPSSRRIARSPGGHERRAPVADAMSEEQSGANRSRSGAGRAAGSGPVA